MKIMIKYIILIPVFLLMTNCKTGNSKKEEVNIKEPLRLPVIMDTDANNELDDQHAIAYMLLNSDVFDVWGITVNATRNGGDIDQHYQEAIRVIKLSGVKDIPVLKGANASFSAIRPTINNNSFDGKSAVDFIINSAREIEGSKLILMPIGKLTNIALALSRAPDIKDKVRIVWLGSNYPEPGEYNQDNDTTALNYILNTAVPFEMVTVRYGKASGSDAVRITPDEVNQHLKGKGPKVAPVTGRHGGEFTCFGDYSVSLFSQIDLYGDPPSRALFDLVAVAVVKNPDWGNQVEIPAPVLIDNKWAERPGNRRKITIWENFNKEAILEDLYTVFN